MSTNYVSREDMTVRDAIRITGWSKAPGVKERKGSACLTDGKNYVHVESLPNGLLEASRYGDNKVDEFTDLLNMVSEYED